MKVMIVTFRCFQTPLRESNLHQQSVGHLESNKLSNALTRIKIHLMGFNTEVLNWLNQSLERNDAKLSSLFGSKELREAGMAGSRNRTRVLKQLVILQWTRHYDTEERKKKSPLCMTAVSGDWAWCESGGEAPASKKLVLCLSAGVFTRPLHCVRHQRPSSRRRDNRASRASKWPS